MEELCIWDLHRDRHEAQAVTLGLLSLSVRALDMSRDRKGRGHMRRSIVSQPPAVGRSGPRLIYCLLLPIHSCTLRWRLPARNDEYIGSRKS